MPLKLITAGLLLVAILLLVAHLEYRFAPTEAKVRDEHQGRMLYPIPCTATLSQRGAGEQWLTRCYISSSDKGKQ